MKVWRFRADCNRDMVIRSAIDYFRNHFVARGMAANWRSPPIRVVGTSKRVRDFVSWMNSTPVFSEYARKCLEPLIAEHCEFLPLIELRGIQYYAVNVLTVLDCFDAAGSQVLYANDDPSRIIHISSYMFRDSFIPVEVPIFKIPDDNYGTVFVQSAFIDKVITSRLRGASFEDPAVEPFGRIVRGESLNVIPGLPE